MRPRRAGRVRVPGGTFVMGSTPAADGARARALRARDPAPAHCHDDADVIGLVRAEGLAHPVTLSSFELDRTEVTVADYAPLRGGRGVRAAGALRRATRASTAPTCPSRTCAGTTPPTTAAGPAAGCRPRPSGSTPRAGVDGREFPWGNVYNPHLANHGALGRRLAPTRPTGSSGLAPVGSFPDGATPLGLLDMAGNVAEWVADVLEIDTHGHPVGYPARRAVSDPPPKTVGRAGGGFHVVRGGSYLDAAMWLRAAARDYDLLLQRPPWVGFRCAASTR